MVCLKYSDTTGDSRSLPSLNVYCQHLAGGGGGTRVSEFPRLEIVNTVLFCSVPTKVCIRYAALKPGV